GLLSPVYAVEVLLLLSCRERRDPLAGDALEIRQRGSGELGAPDLHVPGAPGIHGRHDALVVWAERSALDGSRRDGLDDGERLAAVCPEHPEGAVSAGHHDLAAVIAERRRVGCRTGVNRDGGLAVAGVPD